MISMNEFAFYSARMSGICIPYQLEGSLIYSLLNISFLLIIACSLLERVSTWLMGSGIFSAIKFAAFVVIIATVVAATCVGIIVSVNARFN